MKLNLAIDKAFDGLTAAQLKVLQDEYTQLAKQLSSVTQADNWTLAIQGGTRGQVFVTLKSGSGPSHVFLERAFNFREKTVEHLMFSMARQMQSKGLADYVLRTSVNIMDKLKWSKILTHANLDVGGYAWLRKGFFPEYRKGEAGKMLLRYAKGKDYSTLAKRLDKMKDADVRAFVLSEEFRKFKSAFIGSDWEGSVDISDPAQRKALLRGTTPPPTPTKAPPNPGDPGEAKPAPVTRRTRTPRPRAAAPAASLTNATVRHQVYLERLKTAEARDYNRLLAILQKQVDEAIARLGQEVNELSRTRLNGMLAELRGAQAAATNQAQDRLMRRLNNISIYEASLEADTINALAPGVGIVAASAEAAWVSASTVPLSATGDLLRPFVKDITENEVAQINKLIMKGYAEGWDNAKITRALRGTKAQNYRDGLMNRIGRHNATMVRTAVQHVSNQSREATWAENDITQYRWVSTLDGRTTSQCRTLDGQTFTIGKGPRPPIHMGCRSCTVAVIPGLENLSDSLTRASKDGQVGGSVTYYEWLKTQSAEFQNSVLGPVRAALFREGGLTADQFARLQLSSTFEPLTLDEMRKLEPLAFRRAGIDDD